MAQEREHTMGVDNLYCLSVDDRKEKPFHCAVCGDDYSPCKHWHPEEEIDD